MIYLFPYKKIHPVLDEIVEDSPWLRTYEDDPWEWEQQFSATAAQRGVDPEVVNDWLRFKRGYRPVSRGQRRAFAPSLGGCGVCGGGLALLALGIVMWGLLR